MNKYFVIISFLLSISLISLGCKYRSYGSSELMNKYESKTQFISERDQNCAAWKFHIITTIYELVEQKSIKEFFEIKKNT